MALSTSKVRVKTVLTFGNLTPQKGVTSQALSHSWFHHLCEESRKWRTCSPLYELGLDWELFRVFPCKFSTVSGTCKHFLEVAQSIPPSLGLGLQVLPGKGTIYSTVFWWIYGSSFHFRNVWEDPLLGLRPSLFSQDRWRNPFPSNSLLHTALNCRKKIQSRKKDMQFRLGYGLTYGAI